jgi:S1-C subfamily serine protease
MPIDLTVAMIGATVRIDQAQAGGGYTYGTGFLVQDPAPDGTPRTVLITAAHVFDNMPGPAVELGYRFHQPDGSWKLQREEVQARQDGKALWVRDPAQDVAAMVIQAPPEFARAAIPLAWLADETTFDKAGVRPGDEVDVLGFPGGLASNDADFPILRIGRVASYPLTPVMRYQSFVIDFGYGEGNSGGPVFVVPDDHGRGAAAPSWPSGFVAGLLTKQVDQVQLGIVLHAVYLRQTLALLDVPGAPQPSPRVPAASAP